MAPPIRAILFDLDGTLVQTRDASWVLFERTNRKFALGIDDREQFFKLFRDNLFVAVPQACGDEERGLAAINHFLELLRKEYNPPLVPGIADVVRTLAARCVLGIVSSNALEAIRRIADDAHIAQCIAHVFAGDIEPDKRKSIRQFLADPSYATLRIGSPAYQERAPKPFEPDEVAFVTDTVCDVRHARECGVRTLGVSWGMHKASDLMEAGAEKVAVWPQEIISWALSPRSNVIEERADEVEPPPETDLEPVLEKSGVLRLKGLRAD
ncbi:Haloacid dehalogenase domain protein hydrolase [Methylocella silvestris BL2]|uniref:phosphoglycolate phosphatase n=1 Tax=Methylocella silvestris (strain DSM 15510 / CIP 108128 / LMG 27833 / NCIMB 13906 / BL2) TaxID=395965 RepID=B8ETI1_METSB|nr:HAD hydrolase-like protein [Methylocella silvestris]ACK52333.1 Haloacid dehalogenase domain protein hydrolase [Methylocella silvestris BL2]